MIVKIIITTAVATATDLEMISMTEPKLKEDWEVFTTDEDWKECWYEQDEDKVYKIAEKIGGEVMHCYYFENPVAYPTSSDGEFIGFLIRKDGVIYGEDEIGDLNDA